MNGRRIDTSGSAGREGPASKEDETADDHGEDADSAGDDHDEGPDGDDDLSRLPVVADGPTARATGSFFAITGRGVLCWRCQGQHDRPGVLRTVSCAERLLCRTFLV